MSEGLVNPRLAQAAQRGSMIPREANVAGGSEGEGSVRARSRDSEGAEVEGMGAGEGDLEPLEEPASEPSSEPEPEWEPEAEGEDMLGVFLRGGDDQQEREMSSASRGAGALKASLPQLSGDWVDPLSSKLPSFPLPDPAHQEETLVAKFDDVLSRERDSRVGVLAFSELEVVWFCCRVELFTESGWRVRAAEGREE